MLPDEDPTLDVAHADDLPVGLPSESVRTGVDIVSIDRIEQAVDRHESFEERVFTAAERDYCSSQASPSQHYAARWAAKEAFIKLVRNDAPNWPFNMREVGIVHRDGQPVLDLGGDAEKALEETVDLCAPQSEQTPQYDTAVSLTHDKQAGFAVAFCVLHHDQHNP